MCPISSISSFARVHDLMHLRWIHKSQRPLTPSPPLTDCSAQSFPVGLQLAGCGLCVARVISSAQHLGPGLNKIWITYWFCRITCRVSACTMHKHEPVSIYSLYVKIVLGCRGEKKQNTSCIDCNANWALSSHTYRKFILGAVRL